GAPRVPRSPPHTVSGVNAVTCSPRASDSAVSAAPAGSASTTRVRGDDAATARQAPQARPPPPTGTTTAANGPPSPAASRSLAAGLARLDRRRAAVQRGAIGPDPRQVGGHRTLRHHHVAGDPAGGRGQRQCAAVVAG